MNRNTLFRKNIAIYSVIYILFYMFTYTEILPLKIGNAAPQLLISVTVAIGFFYGEWAGFVAGMIGGVLADAVAADTVCFNMIALMLLGLCAGIVVNRYMNRNIFSALMLSLAASFIYFLSHWMVFFVFAGIEGAGGYFLYYSLPSSVYSALFILPAYLPGRYIK